MNCTRRDFFLGRWVKEEKAFCGLVPSQVVPQSTSSVCALPSDFTPALCKMQAQLLGLDVNKMTDEEIRKALYLAFINAKRP